MLILIAIAVMLLNLVIQISAVMSSAGFWVSLHRRGKLGTGPVRDAWAMGFVLVKLIVAHLLQVALWAAAFLWCGEFADFRTAFYHSAVNFASLGYGDLVMSEDWRLLGALEACVGVMMFGISAAMLFAGLSHLLKVRFHAVGGQER